MSKARDCAMHLINFVLDNREETQNTEYVINYFKALNLLYISQGIHLALTGEPLFPENINTNPDGVINIENTSTVMKIVGIHTIPYKMEILHSLKETERIVLSYVAKEYGHIDTRQLKDLIKDQEPYKTRNFLPETIKKYYMEHPELYQDLVLEQLEQKEIIK